MTFEWTPHAVALASALVLLPPAYRRWQLSRAKHPSLGGHSRMAKRVARWLPGYSMGLEDACGVDGAPESVQQQRREAFQTLAQRLQTRAPRTLAASAGVAPGLPDLQFTSRYRVPFPFSALVKDELRIGAFWQSSQDVSLFDLDGNRFYDLTGSYGVNVLGLDAYKACMNQGMLDGRNLGPVLGGYHPLMPDVVQRLQAISGLDAVSFHMSGTEAVMQAVRLARYHTGKRYLVRFTGAYHGWWEDVQPGPGNPMPPRETYTLSDMSERTLQVLRTRNDIACVLVNPLQALHPNRSAPGDSTLVDGSRTAAFDRAAYSAWLQRLRQVCTERGIVLVLDEVFVGFRVARGGAQAFFNVQADLVCYGKTLGGGFPVGVVCGKSTLMQRFRSNRPADICFARGTFNAHPYVISAMHAFLVMLDQADVQQLYQQQDAWWSRWAQRFNEALQECNHPVRVDHLCSIWTVSYKQPSRYHWMFQFYLRDQGLALSWVGTGRLIFSLNYSDADMEQVLNRFLTACRAMEAGGWWWLEPHTTHRHLKKQVFQEIIKARWLA
jgi:glutamate-1-semialdehyde 2,1-aminomutase